MFHPHAEAARVRMFAKLGVRLIVVLLCLGFFRDVGAALVGSLPYNWLRPDDVFRVLFHSAWNATPWLLAAVLLLLLERVLIRWLVPTPPAGCLRCGYPLAPAPNVKPYPVCPECGLASEPSTPSATTDRARDGAPPT